MDNEQRPALGFFDLNDEESFVVLVFRHWLASGRAYEALSDLTEVLQDDRLRDGLKPLFEVFQSFEDFDTAHAPSNAALLSESEERVLEEIGSDDEFSSPGVQEFRRVLTSVRGTVRPASRIPRSGHDHLMDVIDRKTAVAHATFCPLG